MKKILTILLALIISFASFSQDEENTKSVKKFGPNGTNFLHSHFSLGFMLPPSEGDGADILYGKSHTFTYGIRYKLRLADFFALGAGINYTYQAWHMDQNDTKVIPDTILKDKEKILTNNLGGDVYLRFNIGKRKNTVGNYIDLGAYGEWAYGSSWKVTNDQEDPNDPLGFEYTTGTAYKLNFIEKINYGLQARIGYGKFVLFGKYRMSDIFTREFKDAVSDSEYPRLIIGLELGLHK